MKRIILLFTVAAMMVVSAGPASAGLLIVGGDSNFDSDFGSDGWSNWSDGGWSNDGWGGWSNDDWSDDGVIFIIGGSSNSSGNVSLG